MNALNHEIAAKRVKAHSLRVQGKYIDESFNVLDLSLPHRPTQIEKATRKFLRDRELTPQYQQSITLLKNHKIYVETREQSRRQSLHDEKLKRLSSVFRRMSDEEKISIDLKLTLGESNHGTFVTEAPVSQPNDAPKPLYKMSPKKRLIKFLRTIVNCFKLIRYLSKILSNRIERGWEYDYRYFKINVRVQLKSYTGLDFDTKGADFTLLPDIRRALQLPLEKRNNEIINHLQGWANKVLSTNFR